MGPRVVWYFPVLSCPCCTLSAPFAYSLTFPLINYLQWLPHCWCRPSPSFPACSRYSRVSRLLNMLPPAEITFDREHACGDVTPRQTGTHAGTSKSPLRRFSNLRRRAHSRAGDPTDSSPRSPVESLMTHDNLPCGGPAPCGVHSCV